MQYDFFNYVDRSMVADNKGYETQGEYGDELVFDDYEAATVRDKEYGGLILESKLPLHNLSNDQIPQLVPAAGMTIGFDFSACWTWTCPAPAFTACACSPPPISKAATARLPATMSTPTPACGAR